MLIVEVCRLFGWDYYQYLAQPVWFIDLIQKKLEIDGKKQEAERRKTEQAGRLNKT